MATDGQERFGDGAFCADSSDVLLRPAPRWAEPSAPCSGASHYSGELSFLGHADAADSAAPDTDLVWSSEGCDSHARFLAGSPRPAPADTRARDEEQSPIPSGDAICAALAAAVPARAIAERALNRSRPAAVAESASFARTVSDGARDGQNHWHDKCKQLRAEAEEAGTSATHAQFEDQRHVCAARNRKFQQESLLIFLQMAAQQKLISPFACVPASDEAAGFVGWTGFRVEPGCGGQFRAGVERLFPETPKLNTLYHLFRRSGLVPQDGLLVFPAWRRAWDGEISFKWKPNRVS